MYEFKGEFKERLLALGACDNALLWVGNRTLEEAWAVCNNPPWMFWLSARMLDYEGWSGIKDIVEVCASLIETFIFPLHSGSGLRQWKAGHAELMSIVDGLYVDHAKLEDAKITVYPIIDIIEVINLNLYTNQLSIANTFNELIYDMQEQGLSCPMYLTHTYTTFNGCSCDLIRKCLTTGDLYKKKL